MYRMQTRSLLGAGLFVSIAKKSSCYKWRCKTERAFDGPYTELPVNGIQRLVNGIVFDKNE